jgi:hypothetical protein
VACWSSDSEGGDGGVRGSDEAGDGAGGGGTVMSTGGLMGTMVVTPKN